MFPTRSIIYKMLKKEADIEKQILTFPLPFDIEFTPYEMKFNEKVIRYCKEEGNNNHLKISKIIIIGDINVGKTSLVKRFCQKTFDSNYKATIGVDFEVERFDVLGIPFNVQIWDTAGQERFRSLASSYYRGANVIVVVFDVGKLESLASCRQWFEDALKENETNTLLPYLFLIGNKVDSIPLSAYDEIQLIAAKMAKTMQAEYWPVSSKTGINVDDLFKRIGTLAFQSSILQEISSSTLSKTEIGKLNINGKDLNQKKIKTHCFSCSST